MSRLAKYLLLLFLLLGVLFLTNLVLCLTGVCNFDPSYALCIISLGTMFLIVVDIVTAWLSQLVPKKWINPNFVGFRVFKFERYLYEALGIKKWKEKVPELGGLFRKFSKGHLQEYSSDYIKHFIIETIYGEMAHTWAILTGLFVFAIFPDFPLNFALPLFLINAFMHTPPAMIQRYTRPKLLKIYDRLLQKEKEVVYNDDISMLPNNS